MQRFHKFWAMSLRFDENHQIMWAQIRQPADHSRVTHIYNTLSLRFYALSCGFTLLGCSGSASVIAGRYDRALTFSSAPSVIAVSSVV